MNQYRIYLVTPWEYKESAERKIDFYMKKDKCSRDEAKQKVPQKYKPMPLYIKQLLLDKIVFSVYSKKDDVKRFGLKSFGIQGMIRDGELFPIEVNRLERFAEKEELVRLSDEKDSR